MKKGVISVVLVMLFASLFSTQLYVFADDVGQIATRDFDNVTSDADGKFKAFVWEKSEMNYVQNTYVDFDRIKKSKEIVVVMDSSAVVNTIIETKKPFDYALFSGGENKDMDLKGSNMTINGDVHSNSGILLSSKDIKITGETKDGSSVPSTAIVEAVTKVKVDGTISPSSNCELKNKASRVDMHDFSDYFIDASTNSGTYFSMEEDPVTHEPYCASAVVNPTGGDWRFIYSEDKDIKFTKNEGEYLSCQYIAGEDMWQINGGTLVLRKDKPLFFDGNVRISNSSIVGSGFIVATGNITVNTMTFMNEDGSEIAADIGIYSIGEENDEDDKDGEVGNITLALGATNFKGLVYAPKGKVEIQTSNTEIYGSIVAEQIIAYNHGLSITHVSTEAHQIIEIPHKSDTHLQVAKGIIGKFVEGFVDQEVKVGALAYKNTANEDENGNVFTLFDMQKEGEVGELGVYIKNIEASEDNASNLGDGLRRAYYLLKSEGDKYADKYIIVLSCTNPDKWTQSEDGTYLMDQGEALNVPATTNTEKGFEYASKILDLIEEDAEANIKTHFVDFKFGAELESIKNLAGTNFYNPNTLSEDDFANELERTLNVIKTNILDEVNYQDVKFTADFEDLLPVGVGFVKPEGTETSEFEIYTSGEDTESTDDDRVGIKKKYNSDDIEVKEDGSKFRVKIKDDSFKSPMIKFLSVGKRKFDGGKITFKMTDLDGNPLKSTVKTEKTGTIEELTVEVSLTVDIN